jgi:hypothetical protein
MISAGFRSAPARAAALSRNSGSALQGGTLSYLTQDQRMGLGGSTYLRYSWPDVYVRGGLDVAGSASAARPLGESVRLDLIPGAEAGVRIGTISDRTVRLAAGVGLSLVF